MNKGPVIAIAVALGLSGAAFAKGASHSNRSAESAETTYFTEADCSTLSVESARNACMRSIDREHHVAGATSSHAGGEGVVHVKNKKHAKHRKHRSTRHRNRG